MSPDCNRSELFEYFTNFEFLDGLLCTVEDTTGLVVMVAMLYGITVSVLYYWTGTIAVPFVVMVFTAGAFVSLLPAGVMQIVALVVLVLITLGGVGLVKRLEVDV